ncbi:HAMP domain-containing sensor histidine kinase [Litoribacillus peritrichatus]|uniref:sensor histidine kinase n=1 Tax=Litoribacillus peritrichatus TaxID=718191 RepID=UPI0031E1D686
MQIKERLTSALERNQIRDQIHLITLLSSAGLLISIIVLVLLGLTLNSFMDAQAILLEDERALSNVRFEHSGIQGHMQEFMRRPSPKKAHNFQNKLNALKDTTQQLGDLAKDEHLVDLHEKVQYQLGHYQDRFNYLWEKFQELGLGLDKGLQSQLLAHAKKLNQVLESHGDETLQIALLKIRQNEKDYFLTNLSIMLIEMKQLYDEFLEKLQQSTLNEADQTIIVELLGGYYNTFVQASYINAEIQQAKLDLEDSHETLAPDLFTWMERVRYDLVNQQAIIKGRIQALILFLVITAVIVGGAVYWAGRFVSSMISSPVSKIVTTLEMLAQGNRDLDIPYRNLDNEIGQIAKAAEVFRASLYEAEKGAVAEAKRQALVESNLELESKVKKRTDELAKRNTELNEAVEKLQVAQHELLEREKLAALGSLVAGVSHELNTPLGNALTVLTSISIERTIIDEAFVAGQITQTQLKGFLEYSQSGLELAEKNLSRASALVKNFKQVAVDQTSESRRQFDLKEVTIEVIETLKPSFKHQNFEFLTDISSMILLDSYPGPYGQVISNLINNACLHGFDGRPYGSIRVSAKRVDDQVVVVVSDDGVGMPEEIQKRIFEPFYTTKLGQGGSGLGMNIVYNMVTGILGGRIQIFSQPDKGTQVELKLPLNAPESHGLDNSMVFGQG